MTDAIRGVIEQFTGCRPPACPWRAFSDPFVQDVIDALPFYEKHQLAIARPCPSRRLVEGLGFYDRTIASIEYEQLKIEREQQRRGR